MKSAGIAIFLGALFVAALSHGARAEERVSVARSGIDIAFAPIEVGREAHIWSDLGRAVEVLDVPGTSYNFTLIRPPQSPIKTVADLRGRSGAYACL